MTWGGSEHWWEQRGSHQCSEKICCFQYVDNVSHRYCCQKTRSILYLALKIVENLSLLDINNSAAQVSYFCPNPTESKRVVIKSDLYLTVILFSMSERVCVMPIVVTVCLAWLHVCVQALR